MSDDTVARLHHDLKIIGGLREGDRVRRRDGYLCLSRPSAWESVARWTRGDNRQQSVACVTNAIHDALAIVEQAPLAQRPGDDRRRAMIRRFVVELYQALAGLRCLWCTYGDDPSLQARILVLRENTLDRLAQLRARRAHCDEWWPAEGQTGPTIVELEGESGFSLVNGVLALTG
jgi:L-alanine-DL-glutamate epimerase-like enolase superfamily enzyme